MEDFTDPRSSRAEKLAVRRSLLLVLAVMAIFIALTKIFPGQPADPTGVPQLTDLTKPSH
ncbi:MAG: hypothetical protein JO128_03330 [Alphaproteobacteria bacterium]|nr:hypothetical protein [Alphaproteobacteria bacterium]